MDRIHKNIKHLRESRNYTKTFVSNEIGKTVTSISDYESGKAYPPIPVIEQYAELFGVYVGDLIGRDLWSEGPSMEVNEPAVGYGRVVREKELLHDRLDDREQQIERVRADVVRLARQLEQDPAAAEYLAGLQKILAHLEKQ